MSPLAVDTNIVFRLRSGKGLPIGPPEPRRNSSYTHGPLRVVLVSRIAAVVPFKYERRGFKKPSERVVAGPVNAGVGKWRVVVDRLARDARWRLEGCLAISIE